MTGYRAGDGRHPGGGFDPVGIMPIIDGSYPVVVKAVVGAESVKTDGDSTGATVSWDPNDRKGVPGELTVLNDPCAALYHELVHAFDDAVNVDKAGNMTTPQGNCINPIYERMACGMVPRRTW